MNTQSASLTYQRGRGILLVLIAAVFWGVSGTVAQYLFHEGLSASWLVVIRLIFSGFGLLFFAHKYAKQNIWAVWKNKQDATSLILFGIVGMLTVQYTYFAAIEQSNAATATILQYLAPVLIACYLCVKAKK